jgi:hypothetical protein
MFSLSWRNSLGKALRVFAEETDSLFLELLPASMHCPTSPIPVRWFHDRASTNARGETRQGPPRNQITRRALLGMDSRKPYETPQWWPGNEGREAMCCSFCGSRDHRYEDCPQRIDPPDVSFEDHAEQSR